MNTAVVVYESMFGSTERVAQVVAAALARRYEVDLVDVTAAPDSLGETGLLVVGAPTHAFGLSRPSTRRSAAGQAPTRVSPQDRGVREWLDVLQIPVGTPGAAFDTRVRVHGMPGSAARRIDRRLRRLGVTRVCPPQTFWVPGSAEPIGDAELERARRWAEKLIAGQAKIGGPAPA
ncbi:MAG: flavodoxin [Actinomycetota bacterium]|nr:MAG: flavodoxin [Actinomycetota bacterium]